jgi:eukaryotic-like serine/threonine-protein kinase
VLLLVAGAAAAAYFISRPKQVPVPAVTGLQLPVARAILEHANFTVTSINVNSSKPPNIVVSEAPASGQKADKGSNVTLEVSQGLGNTTIPSVVGLSESVARKQLTRAHLQVHTQPQTSQQVNVGDAIGTDPRAGQTVASGIDVTLFISSGKPTKLLPNVVGQDQATASAELTAAGFNVALTTQTSNTIQPGNVISQHPGGNTAATPGSTVTIVAAKAPPTTAVPSVVGETPSSAASALKAAGFSVTKTTKDVTDQSTNGLVISQSPNGGSKAKMGSTVTIVVAKFVPTNTPTSTSTSTSSTTSTTSTSTTSSTT